MMTAARPRLYATLALVVLLVGVGALAYVVLRPFLAAIAWAVVLAVAVRGPYSWAERRFPSRKNLLAALASLGMALVVLLPAAVLTAVLVTQAAQAVSLLTAELQARNIGSFGDVVSLPRVARAVSWLSEKTGVTPEEVQARALKLATEASSFLAGKSGDLIVSLFDSLLTFAVTMFLLFFLLRDGAEMGTAVSELIPLPPAKRRELIASLGRMLQTIFRGSLLCALIQGASGGLGWWIAGLSSPILAAAVMAVLSLLPIGGTAIVWLPGALWCWGSGRVGAAIFLAVWGAVVTSFLADNVLKPMLIGGASELSTLVVFLGVFGGLGAFGLLGVFIGPMALALAVWLVEILRRLAEDPGAEEEAPA